MLKNKTLASEYEQHIHDLERTASVLAGEKFELQRRLDAALHALHRYEQCDEISLQELTSTQQSVKDDGKVQRRSVPFAVAEEASSTRVLLVHDLTGDVSAISLATRLDALLCRRRSGRVPLFNVLDPIARHS